MHGEVIEDRAVSFLELFYDLVYVVVIAQAAHHLAGHQTLTAAIEFAIVFGLIWIAWLHGSLYYEIHGREDGRTRSFVFIQMAILALLAVYTGDAAGDGGMGFALTYAVYLLVLTWLWYTVRRRDRPEFLAVTGVTIVGIVVSAGVIALSGFLPAESRLVVWGAYAIIWVLGLLVVGRRSREVVQSGITATDSMVEQFGLFTIIVLGELVVGVVDGMTLVDLDPRAIGTGMLALVVGFGLWWIYFDFVGRRLPRNDGPALTNWMMSHLPITLSIAAAGAATVSLLEHARDERTPLVTSWLLGGSVAVGLLALIVTSRSLVDHERLASVYRPLTALLAGGAIAALLIGWSQPAPWLLALSLVAVLSVVWGVAVERWLRIAGLDASKHGVEVVAAERTGDR